MARHGSRPQAFESLRQLPLAGRAMDWGLGPSALSPATAKARGRASDPFLGISPFAFAAESSALAITESSALAIKQVKPR